MSILYQALSRAARDNARANGNADESAQETEPIEDVRPSRSFRNLNFRRRARSEDGSRWPLFALAGVLVIIAGIWLYTSTLPRGSDPLAEIPLVSDLAEVLGLTDPQPVLIASDADFDDMGDFDAGVPDTGLEPVDLSPPESILTTEAPGGGIEIDDADLTSALSTALNDVSDDTEPADLSSSASETPDSLPDAEIVDAIAAGTPDPVVDQDAASLANTDAPDATDEEPGDSRETLEETLARLASERGFDDLQPPVEIDRTPEINLGEDNMVAMTVEVDRDNQQESFEAAYASLVAGNTESALNLYLDVLKDDPNNTFALFGLASTLQRIGWLSEARATYEELLVIEPDNTGALTNMMTLLSQESPDQALANLIRLHDINPGFSPISAQIGLLLAEQGDYPEAIRNLKFAISLSPDNMMYVYNLAIIYDRLGEHREAQGLYEQVLAASETRDVTVPLEVVRNRVSYLKKL